jgi:uncharacterized membrane protein
MAREPVVVGVVAAPGAVPAMTRELSERLAGELSPALTQRFPGVDWHVELDEIEPAEPSTHTHDLIDAVRRRLLQHGWELGVGLTDLPLRAGRRPVTAHASATYGVGLVSLPALGAVGRERRLRNAVVRLVEGLLGEAILGAGAGDGRNARMTKRLHELASPLGHARQHSDGTVRFVGATLRGNVRLLIGMVRANEPTRIMVRLSRSLVAALGAGAFALVTGDMWQIADGMGWPRLLLLALASVVVTCVALILAHGLWETAASPAARERVIVFNVATWVTLALGVMTLYGALLVLTAATESALIPSAVFARRVGHPVQVDEYLRLASLVASLATIGGALGSLVESDLAVRDAAYRTSGDRHGHDADD